MDQRSRYVGGCLCGALRYEASGAPTGQGYCYCADCRKASGSGFIPFMSFPASSLRVSGETRQFRSRSARGGEAVRNFCPACGGLVFGGRLGEDDAHTIYAGSLDDPSGFEPRIAIFAEDRPDWAPTPAGVALFDALPLPNPPAPVYLEGMEQHAIAAENIAATIAAAGAELISLRDGAGTEFLWQAGPAWPRHAPVLFPIVGRLKDDTLRHQGKAYRLTQHGFARDRKFEFVERTASRARLALTDDEATREKYPFAFRLELTYEVAENSLTQTFSVTNTGDAVLPASFGAHPAFIWPLAPDVAKEAHTLTFGADELAPIRRVSGGLLRPAAEPTPIEGRTLKLAETLFDDDAVILEHPASRSVRYAAPGTQTITVSWEGMPSLGIWSKLGGAPFLCIEPWHGIASPAGFDGEFSEKPGLSLIPPGQTAIGHLTVTLTNSSNPD